MKKYIIFLLALFVSLTSGCSIDYTSYYNKHPELKPETPEVTDPENPNPSDPQVDPNKPGTNPDSGEVPDVTDPEVQEKLTSELIDPSVSVYPSTFSLKDNKYNQVSPFANKTYVVYSTYYSTKYDTVYIAYDNSNNPTQTLKSKDLAIIEEHLLFYFESDENKTDYKDYLKAIRIYPDYASSMCRPESGSYDNILGCANYNALDAQINLNDLNDLDTFFNEKTYNDGINNYYKEPRRDTFAHEYGHVTTYYQMILKGDSSYESYLRLRLQEDFDTIYPEGILKEYSSGDSYFIQPTEILADDYVELYYKQDKKDVRDTNEYTFEYTDFRNALNIQGGNHTYPKQYLKKNPELFNTMKTYYNSFIQYKETNYDTPFVSNVNGNIYSDINAIISNTPLINLANKDLIVIGEVLISGKTYYRVILSNFVYDSCRNFSFDGLREHPNKIGYVLKDQTIKLVNQPKLIKFTKFNGKVIEPMSYIARYNSKNINSQDYTRLDNTILSSYYDYSVYIDNGYLGLYDYVNSGIEVYNGFSAQQFR